MTFNLVDEGWIPCITKNGDIQEMSIKDTLASAHQLVGILHPSPLVTYSLHRFLLAILHRNFGPKDKDEWKTLWNNGIWDMDILDIYLKKWRSRLEVFDEKRPFYQVPRMDEVKKIPVQILLQEAASGNNPTLFDHNIDSVPKSISTPEVVRYLVARQSYSIGFGKNKPFYFKDSSLIRGLAILVVGDNLFMTLALNMVDYNKTYPIHSMDDDKPTWECDDIPVITSDDKVGTPVSGYLDYLTWQSRRIHLIPEEGGKQIRYCQIAQYHALPDPKPIDSFKCYRLDKKKGYFPIGFKSNKALWRDSHTLFANVKGKSLRPGVLNVLAERDKLRQWGEIDARPSFIIDAMGIITAERNTASVIMWKHERLPLPIAYLDDNRLIDRLREGFAIVEKVGDAIGKSLWVFGSLMLSPGSLQKDGRRSKRSDVRDLIAGFPVERNFWNRLEIPFLNLLEEIPKHPIDDIKSSTEVLDDPLVRWSETVKRTAISSFNEVMRSIDGSVRNMKAVTIAETNLSKRLRGIYEVQQDEVK